MDLASARSILDQSLDGSGRIRYGDWVVACETIRLHYQRNPHQLRPVSFADGAGSYLADAGRRDTGIGQKVMNLPDDLDGYSLGLDEDGRPALFSTGPVDARAQPVSVSVDRRAMFDRSAATLKNINAQNREFWSHLNRRV
jgi:hypothetical protein